MRLLCVHFQLICNQTPRFTIGDCAAGHRADNRDKNRNVLIVPRKLFKLYFTLQNNQLSKISIICVLAFSSHRFILFYS